MRQSWRRLWCSSALLALLAWPGRGVARGDELSPIAAHLRARGASEVVEVARSFLFEGQSAAHEQRLVRASCVGYLALGQGEVRDVDLSLYTHAGQPIAEDLAIAPYAYARVCGEAGLGLYASASLYAGRGQLVLLRIDDAPRELGRLPESFPLAVGAGGRLEELRAVGALGDELSPESALLQDERAYVMMGYVAAGPASAFEIRAGNARGQIFLRAGRCFRIALVVPLSRGVAMEVEGPSGLRWATRTMGDDRAALALCAPLDGAYAVRVQARPVRGTALVRVFEHKSVDLARVRELGEASALAVAEAEHVARARGLRLVPIGSAWVENRSPLVWPLSIHDERCYALAVVSDVGAAAVDVRLIDASGVVIAHNEGRRGMPMVFSCPAGAGAVKVVLKARGPDLRVSLWLGRSERGQP